MGYQLSTDEGVSLYKRVAESVSAAVAEGRVVPGDMLPTQTELAAEFGISTLTVGKGYKLLEERGIVRPKRGAGTFVCDGADRLVKSRHDRQYRTIHLVIGPDCFAHFPHELLFIFSDLLDGLKDVFHERECVIRKVRDFTREDLGTVSDDDAVVLQSSQFVDVLLVRELAARNIPVISVGTGLEEPLQLSTRGPIVDFDRYQSVALAVRHLVDCGYQRLGFIGNVTTFKHRLWQKYAAFVQVLLEAGLDQRACDVQHAPRDPGMAYAAVQKMLSNHDLPEAIFVDTDYKAMEAICALRNAGLSVPDDIGIVAYDDISEAKTFDPPLTTVCTPRVEIGRQIGRMLRQWPTDGSTPEDVILTSTLSVRNSTRSNT